MTPLRATLTALVHFTLATAACRHEPDARPLSAGSATRTAMVDPAADGERASPEAGAGPAGCGPDIATRRPGAEPVEGIDLDGDGDRDLVFRYGHDLHGNAEFLFYRVDGDCATYLGSIESFVVDTPRCVEPRVAGRICRLSATRRMFHDDYQETFYVQAAGAFHEAGHGRYVQPSERAIRKRGN